MSITQSKEFFLHLFRGGLDTYAIAKHTDTPEAKVLKAITVARRPDTDFLWPPPPRDMRSNTVALLEAQRTGKWVSRMRK